ncbi:MAG TPA: hypothetical protein PLJ37_01005 [Chitinophagales bacterium]|nr:hypothetical protein [Chitinophagales bacterium]HMW93406.1 hypothetical protein [Chitinophagales bacterium]HMZ92972.1 hypothetical protein [Chitinophagales bacterium]HNG25965.1 hypothetical protein [Chitinophagales bacterium]
MRKPIHISVIPLGSNYINDEVIYALCDDGTIWYTSITGTVDYSWTKVNPIPQDGSQVV